MKTIEEFYNEAMADKALEEAVADAATWLPAAPAADEKKDEAAEAPAADEKKDEAAETPAPAPDTSADKDTQPQTGDALSLSIVMIGAVAVVAFVASKKKANA